MNLNITKEITKHTWSNLDATLHELYVFEIALDPMCSILFTD